MTTGVFKKHYSETDLNDLIERMDNFIVPYWLTVSPDPKENPLKGEKYIDKWIEIFIKWLPALRDAVFVLETASMRFHWHIMLDIKDKYKWGIMYRALTHYHRCTTKIYAGKPEGGVKYLFKDIKETLEHLKKSFPVATFDQFGEQKAIRSKKALEERRKQLMDSIELNKMQEVYELTHNKKMQAFLYSDSDSDISRG